MLREEIFKFVSNNIEVKNFLKGIADFQTLYTKLTKKDLIILDKEFSLLGFEDSDSDKPKISQITIIKKDLNSENYKMTKKIKIYINEQNQSILKILKN